MLYCTGRRTLMGMALRTVMEEPADQGAAVAEGLRNALARHQNDATALAAQLYTDCFNLREKNRKMQTDWDEDKKKIPAAGTVTLSEQEAKDWEAYKALGKPEDVSKQLKDAETDKQKLAATEKEKVVTDAATAYGLNPAVLKKLVATDEVEVILGQKDENGQKVTTASVKLKDGSVVDLKQHAEAAWKDFLPSLMAAGGGQGDAGGGNQDALTQWVNQGGGGSQQNSGLVDIGAEIEKMNKTAGEKKNPLTAT